MAGQNNETIGGQGSGATAPPDPSAGTAQPGGNSAWPTNAIDWARLVHRALRGRYRKTVFIVLAAMGVGEALAACGLRASFGWSSTMEDVNAAVASLVKLRERKRDKEAA